MTRRRGLLQRQFCMILPPFRVYRSRFTRCRTLRHSFSTHLLEGGYHIRTVRELLGRKDLKTTMIHTHVLKRAPAGVCSPVDGL